MKLPAAASAAPLTLILLSVAVMFSVLFITNIEAQEEMLCKGQKLNMTEKQMGFIIDCLKEFGYNSIWDVPADKFPCFGVCCMEKKGLLTPDGKLDHDKIYDYIYHVMQPDEVRKPLVDGTEKCMKDHGQQVRRDKDPECTQYMETGQCVQMVFHNICNT